MPLRPEIFLKAYFEGTRDLIGVSNADRRIVAANKAFQNEFGYTESEIIGQKTDILYAEPDVYETLGRERFHPGAVDRTDLYRAIYRRKNNETFVGDARAVVIYDQRGKVAGFIGIIRDVTESIEREQFFKNVAGLTGNTDLSLGERLESLLEAARIYLRISAVVLSVTEDFSGLLENGPTLASIDPAHSAEEPSIERILELCDNDPAANGPSIHSAETKLADCGSTSEPLVIDGGYLGSLHLVGRVSDAESFADRELEVKKVIGPALASQLKLAQQNHDLELREARFRRLYRKTPAMMHSIDEAGNLTEISDAWLKTLGYRRSEVIGKKSITFLTEESKQFAINTVLPEFFANGFVNRVPYTFLTKDGEPIEIELSGYLNSERTSLAVLEDVTERNAAQRELLLKNNALLTANEELKQFAFVASHDLQEPLRKIQAFCDVLEEALQAEDAEEIQHAMSVLNKSAERSSRLIKDLLTFSRVGNREFKKVDIDVGLAIQDALKDMSKMVAGVDATVSMQVSDLTINGDRAAFLQLVENLINNGIKYHRPGTRPHVRILSESHDCRNVLKVEDNGIGVDWKYSQTIFEPFKRLHPQAEYDGTGIGLAICKKIADRHGWQIALESTGEAGATFSLTIPLAA